MTKFSPFIYKLVNSKIQKFKKLTRGNLLCLPVINQSIPDLYTALARAALKKLPHMLPKRFSR